MEGHDGERGVAANLMLPGETERQSAPATSLSSTLYSIEYDVQMIENAVVAEDASMNEMPWT
jgi:hypothetical protein